MKICTHFEGHIPKGGIAECRAYKYPALADIGEQTLKVVVSIYTLPVVCMYKFMHVFPKLKIHILSTQLVRNKKDHKQA